MDQEKPNLQTAAVGQKVFNLRADQLAVICRNLVLAPTLQQLPS
jgi:hypothetical protein